MAATSRAAALIGQEETIGTIEIGKKADLIILNENPLDQGMQALRKISLVSVDGVAKTPAEWME